MNTQSMQVLFWLNRSKVKAGENVPVNVRISVTGFPKKEISLGIRINPENWDMKFKQVTTAEPDHKRINKKIKNAESFLGTIFKELSQKFDIVEPMMIKRVFKRLPPTPEKKEKTKTDVQMSLLMAFDEHIADFAKLVKKKKRSKGTLRHWKSTKRKVAAFLLYQYKKKDIDIKEVGDLFAEQMLNYLTIDVEELAENTAKKHIKWTRQIVGNCLKKKLIKSNPMEGFKCSGGDKEVEPLEYHEVLTIFQKPLGIERLEQIRDCYIVQCFTGFAYKDLADLSPENITLVGLSKEKWLIKERGKTTVSEQVPVLPIVDEIIKKYENHPCRLIHNRLLPVPSNTNYNAYLKEIGTICGIKRELHTHLARHTFADIVLNLGVPLEDVSKMLGHTSIRTTLRYCRVKKSRISNNMKLVRKALFTKEGKLKYNDDKAIPF